MDNSTSNVFGSMLRELRERRNLTQQALGYKIGKKSRGDIQAWESGRHLPKERETVLALARALSPLTPGEVDRLLLAAHHVPESMCVGHSWWRNCLPTLCHAPTSLIAW